MSILTVVKDVCAAVGVMVPSSIFSGLQSNRTMQEMLALANEMAQRIAYDTRDWTVLKKQLDPPYYVGDGVKTAWDLPANFKRMLLTGNVWLSTSTQQPARFIPDTDEWMQRRANNYTDAWGEWTMLGGQMIIAPALGVDVTARYAYLDKNCITLYGGGYGATFMNDVDVFRLDERLLKLGMIWQWMANKGSPYAEPMGTYSDALANAMGHDQPAPILIGRKPISSSARIAVPSQTLYLPKTPSFP